MTPGEKGLLFLSVVASVAIWSLSLGLTAGVAFTLSLLFHEYGHYYWMGREGIKSKRMLMVPPFGAIAIAKEPWPSLGAEARIALAGPGFGLISVVVLFLAEMGLGSYDLKIAMFAICMVNLSNFWIPIAVLDGGRVIKPLLFSFNKKLGLGFYYFSFFVLFFLIFWYASIFIFIVGFLLFQALSSEFDAMKRYISSGNIVVMSKREICLAVFLFLLVSAGLYTIMLTTNLSFGELIEFIKSR